MTKIFATETMTNRIIERKDFETEDAARQYIEGCGHGSVISFIRDFEGRCRSYALDSYNGTEWISHNIFG